MPRHMGISTAWHGAGPRPRSGSKRPISRAAPPAASSCHSSSARRSGSTAIPGGPVEGGRSARAHSGRAVQCPRAHPSRRRARAIAELPRVSGRSWALWAARGRGGAEVPPPLPLQQPRSQRRRRLGRPRLQASGRGGKRTRPGAGPPCAGHTHGWVLKAPRLAESSAPTPGLAPTEVRSCGARCKYDIACLLGYSPYLAAQSFLATEQSACTVPCPTLILDSLVLPQAGGRPFLRLPCVGGKPRPCTQ